MDNIKDLQNALQTLRFPFLGQNEEGEPFEYILNAMQDDRVEIAVFEWLVNRTKLKLEDKVHLFIPQRLSAEFSLREDTSGTITAVKRHEAEKMDVYEVVLHKDSKTSAYNLSLASDTSQRPVTTVLEELLIKLIKDSMFLKFGINIYLKHLSAYFSRISNFSTKEYADFRMLLLRDVENRVEANGKKLESLFRRFQTEKVSLENISMIFNLEELREIMESEISLSLFHIALAESPALDFPQQDQTSMHRGKSLCITYINAIKNLEKRLYSNYNHIVVIFALFV